MPYIREEDREQYRAILKYIEKIGIACAGDLNYLITVLSNIYLEESGKCYTSYNEVIGVLECAKQEYYRKKIAPYEDKKCKENGAV